MDLKVKTVKEGLKWYNTVNYKVRPNDIYCIVYLSNLSR